MSKYTGKFIKTPKGGNLTLRCLDSNEYNYNVLFGNPCYNDGWICGDYILTNQSLDGVLLSQVHPKLVKPAINILVLESKVENIFTDVEERVLFIRNVVLGRGYYQGLSALANSTRGELWDIGENWNG